MLAHVFQPALADAGVCVDEHRLFVDSHSYGLELEVRGATGRKRWGMPLSANEDFGPMQGAHLSYTMQLSTDRTVDTAPALV